MDDNKEQKTEESSQSNENNEEDNKEDSPTETVEQLPAPSQALVSKLGKAIDKLNSTNKMIDLKKEKEFLTKSNLNASTLVSLIDKKAIQLRNKQFQEKLELFQHQQILDLADKETCSKQIKSQQEMQFLAKFIRILSVFKAREELLKTSQISNKIIQNLRCVFIKKNNPLFKYGDRGNEYFILLQGKAFCLVPYSNTFPLEQIRAQTKNRRLTPQVTEDPEDDDFLYQNYAKFQSVKIYYPGEAFGEIALLTTESKRMASIVCKEDSWFMSLNREGFNQIQGSYQQHLLNEKVYFMKKFEIFKPVAINKILSFLHDVREQTYIMGKSIYSQGQKGETIYFLMDGEVEIVREMVHVGASRMQNQKYEMYFKNTKHTPFNKQIVLLGCDNYFGDEDILSPDKIHSYTAICRSQTCKILEIDLRTLIQFLKVYETFSLFKRTAINKQSHYDYILSQDCILDKNNIIEPHEQPIQIIDQITDDIQFGGVEQNVSKDRKQQKQNKNIQLPYIQTPQNSDRSNNKNNNNNDTDEKKKSPKFIPKFHNVYNYLSNQNIRAKNYLSLNNAFQSSVKFSLEDVPMTTKMNQDETDLKRIQFRLSKNLQSASNKPLASVPYQQGNSENYQLSKLAQSLNGSFDLNTIQMNQSGSSGKLQIQNLGNSQLNNSLRQYSRNNSDLTESLQHQKRMNVINFSQLNTMKVMDQFNERQNLLQFSMQLKQQSNQSLLSFQEQIQNLIPQNKFPEYLTPQNKRRYDYVNENTPSQYQKQYIKERKLSEQVQNSPRLEQLKGSKNVTDYQENIIAKKNKGSYSFSQQTQH